MKCNSKFSLLLLVVLTVSILSCAVYAQENVEKNDSIPDSQGAHVQKEIEKPTIEEPAQTNPEIGSGFIEAQKKLDRYIWIVNLVVVTMGVMVALITLVVIQNSENLYWMQKNLLRKQRKF